MGVCNYSMFCCMLLYVHSSIAIILMGKRELIALLNLSSWCFVMVKRLFLGMPRGCLWFVIVVFPDHTHLLFFMALLLDLSKTLDCLPHDLLLLKLKYYGLSENALKINEKLFNKQKTVCKIRQYQK